MKRKITTICLIGILALGACNMKTSNDSNIAITTKDNGSDLNFKANYPINRTAAAHDYIENSLKEERIFNSTSDIKKVEVKLADGTLFYLNYEPGFISINFDRERNSFTSYNRMKKMIAGFGNAIKD